MTSKPYEDGNYTGEESVQQAGANYAFERAAATAPDPTAHKVDIEQALGTTVTDLKEDITKRKKPILCLDFDGVLHSYASGWKGPEVIPDPPVPGAMEFLYTALQHFEVHIFSSRSAHEKGIAAMYLWLDQHFKLEGKSQEHMWSTLSQIKWPASKPPAFVTIDDRTIQFQGVFPSIEELQAFKPWWEGRSNV